MPSTGCSTYKTYCGYCGTETGTKTSGLCPTTITDTVPNTGTQYFAAFPIGSFGQGTYCGMCVQVTYMSKTITATIVDECATCPTAGHIDLSLAGALALGLDTGGSTADPTSGVTWKAVDCPVTGNIVAVFNVDVAGDLLPERRLPGGPGGRGRSYGHPADRLLELRHRGGRPIGHPDRHRRPRRDGNHPEFQRRQRRCPVPADLPVTAG